MAPPPVPPSRGGYEIEGRDLVEETDRLRVQILTVGPGQCVPWHHHTVIRDTFVCLEGPMTIETRDPGQRHQLEPGQRLTVPPGRPHRVSGADGGRCRFVIVQGIGAYDYVPDE